MNRRRKVRDIYGNWVLKDEEVSGDPKMEERRSNVESQEEVHLDWRDYIALSIASLETFLLPVVVFIIVLVILAIVFVHL